MANRVLLNNVDHADVRVIARHDAAFGDAINQVLVFPTEFEALQRDYPIFFRRDANGEFQSIALLGLDRDENLFLGAGGWQARHVPALQRRGPFSIAVSADGAEPMIHIDLDHPRVSRSEGEPLFLPAGGNAPYLQQTARVLGTIYDGLEVARAMFATFEALELIEPVAVDVEVGEGRRYEIPGLHTVAEERLSRLRGEDLERLHASGLLRAATFAGASLANVARLIELKQRKLAGG